MTMDDNPWGVLMIICLVVIVIIVICCSTARAAECRLVNWREPWEPDPEDVAYISRTIWGEVRGCSREEQEGVACCIILRKRSPDFPDTIEGVVLQPNQWQGYSPNNPEEPFHDLARDILLADHYGEAGPLPAGFFWCSGDGKHQTFRNTWIRTEETRYWP